MATAPHALLDPPSGDLSTAALKHSVNMTARRWAPLRRTLIAGADHHLLAPRVGLGAPVMTIHSPRARPVIPARTWPDTPTMRRTRGMNRADLGKPDGAPVGTGYVTGGVSPFGQRRRVPTLPRATGEIPDPGWGAR